MNHLLKPIIAISLIFFLFSCQLYSQETQDTMKLTLQEALDIALEQNNQLKNSNLDVKIADEEVWITTAQGLPQISANGSYNNNLSLSTQLFPNFIEPTILQVLKEEGVLPPDTPIPEPDKIEVQFGTQHNVTGTIQANQLIFSGPYIVGLQAARVYKNLAKEQYEMTKLNVKSNVTNTYHSILLTRRNIEILNENLDNLNQTLEDTRAMYKNGMAEETDVDQLRLNVSSLENNLKSTKRQMESLKNLLKIQMGVELETSIVTTESVQGLVAENQLNKSFQADFNVEQNINYQASKTQVELSELDLKRQKANFLPSLSAFYSFTENAMRDEFTFFESDEPWYESSMVGFQLNVPIFSSFQRYSKVQKAKLNLKKSQNNLENTRKNLRNQFIQARNDYLTAYEKYQNDKENKKLAKKIFQRTNKKYKEGMATSMELTQANDKYLQMESAYISSLIQLLNAKVELEKILNEL
jgi:outer membrane protein TolC